MTTPTIAGVTAAQFDAALEEFTDAVRADWYKPRDISSSERVNIKARARVAAERVNTLRDVMCLAFAKAYGWTYAAGKSLSKTDVFIDPKTRHVVARVHHGFEPFDKFPVGGERLPFSWRKGATSHCSPGKPFAALVKELV